MSDDKVRLRLRLRAARDQLSEGERRQRSERIWARFVAELLPARARVGLYASSGGEVETDGLFAELRRRGHEVCYPRVDRSARHLEFVPVSALETLRTGAFGLREPAGEAVPAASLAVLVVPGVGFDRAGHRVGMGGGYYDRVLAAYQGMAVGFAFACQLVDVLPALEHDRPVDCVVTEEGVVARRSA